MTQEVHGLSSAESIYHVVEKLGHFSTLKSRIRAYLTR